MGIQYISIVIELVIAVLGLMIALQKKKVYGWGIFVTFGIYVFYDLSKLMNWNIPELALQISFFIATLSALWAVYCIYKERKTEKRRKR